MATDRPRYGSHLSVAGGLHLALEEAARLKLDSVQIFTKNQRQWSSPPLAQEQVERWRATLREIGWVDPSLRVVSHNSYLANLASPDDEQRRRSIALQRSELERCEELGIGSCVMHPGAHLGQARRPGDPNKLRSAPSADELAGIKRIAAALDEIHASLPGARCMTCLETTTGAGTNLGYDFAHLAAIRNLVREPERVGICLDTCHVVAAGYDMSTPAKATAVLDEFDSVCGLEHLRVVHVNDSAGLLGSRRDRHAHIGQGCCGEACFRGILVRRELRETPMILETPKDGSLGGQACDLANIETLESIRSGRGASRAARAIVGVMLLSALVSESIGCRSSRFSAPPDPTSVVSAGVIRQPTENERTFLAAAQQFTERGDYQSALILCEDVLSKNPLLPQAYVGVGDVRFAQGRYGDAEPNYRKAAKLDPGDYRAQFGHGRSLQMLGRLGEAIGAYQRAIAVNPKSAEANLNMSTAYLSLGDARVAEQFAQRAALLEPSNGAAHINLGVAFERLGRPADAIRQYHAAAELMPQTPQLLINLVNAYVADGRYPEAVNTAVALTKLSGVPQTYERLGWAEFRAGNYNSSSVAYRQAVVLDPQYWPAWNGIGVNALNRWLLSQKKDAQACDEARKAFRASMRANANQPKVLKLYTTYGL